MKKLNIHLTNPSGLHARPAKNLVNIAKQYSAQISIFYQGKKANGKSLISILTLGVESGAHIDIEIDGDDEEAASEALKAYIENGLLKE